MEITDSDILATFITTNNKLNTKKLGQAWLLKHTELSEYLLNRYSDSLSNVETIYRIKYGIENRPVCKYCGSPINFINYKDGYRSYCSHQCAAKSEERKIKYIQTCNILYGGIFNPKKSKQTCLEKYGVDNYSKTEEFKKQYKQTCLEKYGITNTFQLPISRQTCLKKYGVLYPGQSIEIQEKSKKSCLDKYGVPYSFQSENNKTKSKRSKKEKYGNEYFLNKEKQIQTSISHYGVDNPAKSIIIKEKIKQTNMSKYGVKAPSQNDQIKQKAQLTNLSRYGVNNPAKSNQIMEKRNQTNLQVYGNKCPIINKDIQKKAIQTMINHFGIIYQKSDDFKNMMSIIMSSKEMQDHRYKIQKQRKTFNSSKIETQFKKYLEETFHNDFEYQYKSEKYPFVCDFYIKSLDLYIEIQGSWTHGKHPFNKENKEDIQLLNKWKDKNTKYYDNAISTWTIRDINKRKTAIKNNLNYLEIFSSNINQVIIEFKKYIENEQ